MIIKKSRINSCSYFATAIPNSPVHIRVDDVGRFESQMQAFGFQRTDEIGTTILPSGINCYTKKNSEPFYVIDKSLPKEEYTQTVYWTRHEWAGRGQTNPVTDFSYISRKRYHRDYFAPYGVCFTLEEYNEKQSIVSEPIIYTEENYDKLLNTVNMVLSVFGECKIEFSQKESGIKRTVVNWDILPPGKHPWKTVKETLRNAAKGQTKTRTEMLIRNCESIYEKEPDFVAYGRAGFRGYAVFGFTNKNLYVLESALPNNATYILQNDWESISQLTKAEILSKELHKSRIVHAENWQKNFDEILGGTNG